MANQPDTTQMPRPRRTRILVFIFAISALVFWQSYRYFQSIERDGAKSRAEIFQSAIEDELTRLEHLPAVIAETKPVQEALQNGQFDTLNEKLAEISQSSQAEAIYLLDPTGLTISASNYDQPQTFLGQNYGFRAYFKQALSGQPATLFAIGATTSRPGYFIAAPVQPKAVLTVKLDLTALNQALENSGENVLVLNRDGIVVLSSDPAIRYQTTRAISDERRLEIAEERQLGNTEISELNWQQSGNRVRFQGATFLAESIDLSRQNWQLIYLTNIQNALFPAVATTSIFTGALVLLALIAGFVRENRVRRALAVSQEDRKRLRDEITVRKETEQRLERAHTELEQSSKMAALGQLAASVTHELGQPISAMRNHIAAQEIANNAPAKFLGRFDSLVKRMEDITNQLRFFASKSAPAREMIAAKNLLQNALAFVAHDFDHAGVKTKITDQTKGATVAVSQDRIERVFVNILQNSARAMAEQKSGKMDITLRQMGEDICITFADTGPGLKGQTIDKLKEPFHTTRASGDGMGLGLAISDAILKEHSGHMEASDHKGGGAEFRVYLPKAGDAK